MSLNKILKKFICFSLLYTILFSNTSIFYTFANDLSTENKTSLENNIETSNTDNENIENSDTTQQEETNDPLNLVAQSAVLIDANTGIVLYDKDMNAKSYPASTTKVLTALLTLENTQLADTVTHSNNAVFNIMPGSSHIGMRENETITVEQALYGVLLASANEVCMALAEKISGTVEEFTKLMNKRAKELGAKNTNFTNSYGATDENHYTTAYDMALFMKGAIKNEEFVKIISTPTYKIPKTNIVDEERTLNNSNKMIMKTSPFYYEYVIGSKTGYTSEAGNTLVSYGKKGNIELIAVVMKDDKTKVYDDTKALFEYGFSVYEEKNLFDKTTYNSKGVVAQKFNDTEVTLGEIYLEAENNLSLKLPKTVDVSKIEKNIKIPNPIIAPVNAGDTVGEIEFLYEDSVIAKVNIISKDTIETVDEAKLKKKENKKKIFDNVSKVIKYVLIIIIIIIVLLFLIAPITRRIAKEKRRKRKMNNKYKYYNVSSERPLKPMDNKRGKRRR